MTIHLDCTGMTRGAVPSGVAAERLAALAPRAEAAHAGMLADAAAGRLGFRELEAQGAERARVVAWARERQGH